MINLFGLVACGTYLSSFLYFERLLKIEARSCPGDWHQDGQPVGIHTWAKDASARPYYNVAALFRCLRLYVKWLFRTPGWVREAPTAYRTLLAVRSLFWLLVIELMVCKELM